MTLNQWLNDGRLKPHTTSKQEIDQLLEAVERNIKDASIEALSSDNRFNIAYQAILQLATIALYVKGYRPVASKGHHYITIQSLAYTIGIDMTEQVAYFDHCRTLRNTAEYERAGIVSDGALEELLDELEDFKKQVLDWLSAHYGY